VRGSLRRTRILWTVPPHRNLHFVQFDSTRLSGEVRRSAKKRRRTRGPVSPSRSNVIREGACVAGPHAYHFAAFLGGACLASRLWPSGPLPPSLLDTPSPGSDRNRRSHRCLLGWPKARSLRPCLSVVAPIRNLPFFDLKVIEFFATQRETSPTKVPRLPGLRITFYVGVGDAIFSESNKMSGTHDPPIPTITIIRQRRCRTLGKHTGVRVIHGPISSIPTCVDTRALDERLRSNFARVGAKNESMGGHV